MIVSIRLGEHNTTLWLLALVRIVLGRITGLPDGRVNAK
jgi:hypothetical protein